MRMKKAFLPLIACAAVIGAASWAVAEEFTPYTVDFNEELAVSGNHEFKVADGWKHIADKSEDGYMNYSYYSTSGVGSTGCLYAGKQEGSQGYSYYAAETHDYLVTPPVSGTISLDVKKYSYSDCYIELYKTNATGTAVEGSYLKKWQYDSDGISSSEYKTISYEVGDEPVRIAIRASRIYMDNFSASKAVVELEPELNVSSIVCSQTKTNPTYWNQDAEGNITITYTVKVTNTGKLAVAADAENNTVSLVTSKGVVLGTAAVNQALEPGQESDDIVLTGKVAKADLSTVWSWSSSAAEFVIRENISGTSKEVPGYQYYNEYKTEFVFRKAGETSTRSLSDAQAFGMVTAPASGEYEIYSNGAAPITINSIAVGEGFTVTDAEGNALQMPATIAYGEALALKVAMTDASGAHSADLVVNYDKIASGETTATDYKLEFSGNLLAEGSWFADFNNTSSSIKYPAGSVSVSANTSNNYNYNYKNGAYDYYIKGYTSNSDGNLNFVTPKLHANAGDKLFFDAQLQSNNSNYKITVKVSEDRQNWTEHKVFANTDLTTSFTTQSVDFETAGDYYVAFVLIGCNIDNLNGLTALELPAHDMFVQNVKQDAAIQSGVEFAPELTVIPLTSEEAGSYTLKYYMVPKAGGEAQAYDIESVALTASATSNKTLKANLTPVVEANADFTTYFEFDFGDAKIKTQDRDLTVTNEPAFRFLDSQSAGRFDPDNYGKTIAFGKANTSVEKTFYIYNWGSAPTKINSIAVPTGFDVDLVAPFEVPAKTNQPIKIKFTATEPAEYSGNLVITHDNDETYEVTLTGTMLDQNKWYANFDDNKWPAGTVHQKWGTLYSMNGGYAAYANDASSNNMFMTPKLTMVEGEEFSVDARGTALTVYTAASRDALFDKTKLTEVVKYSSSSSDEATKLNSYGDFKTFTFKAPATGDFYLVFEQNYTYIDELYGFKLADKQSDLALVSANIPAEAMQNNAKTVSLTVQNFGANDIAADDYKVNVYINGVAQTVAGTADITATNTTESGAVDISAVMKSPKAGTFPVYIELVAGDTKLATEPVDVTFNEEVASSEHKVGTENGTNNTTLNLYYYNADLTAVYSPEVLDLKAGDEITSISFKGYNTYDGLIVDLNLYYEWVDDASLSAPEKVAFDASAMHAAKGLTEYTYPVAGSASSVVELMSFTFDEPVVYQEGKSLKIYVASRSPQRKCTRNIYFEISSTGQAYERHNDTQSTMESNTWSSAAAPVLYLGVSAEPVTAKGSVFAEDAAVADATVTFYAEDDANVQYEGKTDAEGKFAVNIIQTGHTYKVVAEKEGLKAYVEGFDVAANEELIFNLAEHKVITGTIKRKSGEALEGAKVILTPAPAMAMFAVTAPAGTYTATTDENGEFSMELPKNQKYNVTVEHSAIPDGVYNADWQFDPAQSDALRLALLSDGTMTGIGSIVMDKQFGEKDVIYNLNGVRVVNPTPGIYIVNGKKVYIK